MDGETKGDVGNLFVDSEGFGKGGGGGGESVEAGDDRAGGL